MIAICSPRAARSRHLHRGYAIRMLTSAITTNCITRDTPLVPVVDSSDQSLHVSAEPAHLSDPHARALRSMSEQEAAIWRVLSPCLVSRTETQSGRTVQIGFCYAVFGASMVPMRSQIRVVPAPGAGLLAVLGVETKDGRSGHHALPCACVSAISCCSARRARCAPVVVRPPHEDEPSCDRRPLRATACSSDATELTTHDISPCGAASSCGAGPCGDDRRWSV